MGAKRSVKRDRKKACGTVVLLRERPPLWYTGVWPLWAAWETVTMTETPTPLLCVHDAYDPQTTEYASITAFRDMCEACFGEQPTLTEHGDGTYTDEDGRTVLVPAVINMEIEPGRGMVRLTGPGLVLGLTEYVLGLIDICRLEDDWMPIQGVVRGPLLTDALYARILAEGRLRGVAGSPDGGGHPPRDPRGTPGLHRG